MIDETGGFSRHGVTQPLPIWLGQESRAATLLILLGAAAGKRIVAADARAFVANWLCRLFFTSSESSLVRFGECHAAAALAAAALEVYQQ